MPQGPPIDWSAGRSEAHPPGQVSSRVWHSVLGICSQKRHVDMRLSQNITNACESLWDLAEMLILCEWIWVTEVSNKPSSDAFGAIQSREEREKG